MLEIEIVRKEDYPAIRIKDKDVFIGLNSIAINIDGERYGVARADLLFTLLVEEKIIPEDTKKLLEYVKVLNRGDAYINDLYDGEITLKKIADIYYNNTEKGDYYIFTDDNNTMVFNNHKNFFVKLESVFGEYPEYKGEGFNYKHALFTHQPAIDYLWNEIKNNNFEILDEVEKLLDYYPLVYEEKFEDIYIRKKDLKKEIHRKEIDEREEQELEEISEELFHKRLMPVGEKENIVGYVFSDRYSSEAIYITREPTPKFVKMTRAEGLRMIRAKKFKNYKGMSELMSLDEFVASLAESLIVYPSKEDILKFLKKTGDPIYNI